MTIIFKIATNNSMEPMCIYDSFKSYRDEAEQNESHEFPLYHWTKSTIEDPLKSKSTKILLLVILGMNKFTAEL